VDSCVWKEGDLIKFKEDYKTFKAGDIVQIKTIAATTRKIAKGDKSQTKREQMQPSTRAGTMVDRHDALVNRGAATAHMSGRWPDGGFKFCVVRKKIEAAATCNNKPEDADAALAAFQRTAAVYQRNNGIPPIHPVLMGGMGMGGMGMGGMGMLRQMGAGGPGKEKKLALSIPSKIQPSSIGEVIQTTLAAGIKRSQLSVGDKVYGARFWIENLLSESYRIPRLLARCQHTYDSIAFLLVGHF
jgi:hypothetical protein